MKGREAGREDKMGTITWVMKGQFVLIKSLTMTAKAKAGNERNKPL